MKLIYHARSPKITEMTLSANPMRIFVTKTVELRIEKGDCLGDVVNSVIELLPKGIQPRELVALWYAMGERVAAGNNALEKDWRPNELSADIQRRYLHA